MTVTATVSSPAVVLQEPGPLQELREAIVARLRASAPLVAMLNGDPSRIVWRFARKKEIEDRTLTYFDQGIEPAPSLPRIERLYQFDVWTADKPSGSAIAEAVIALLNRKPFGKLRRVNVQRIQLQYDRDDPQNKSDLTSTLVQFLIIGVRLKGGGG